MAARAHGARLLPERHPRAPRGGLPICRRLRGTPAPEELPAGAVLPAPGRGATRAETSSKARATDGVAQQVPEVACRRPHRESGWEGGEPSGQEGGRRAARSRGQASLASLVPWTAVGSCLHARSRRLGRQRRLQPRLRKPRWPWTADGELLYHEVNRDEQMEENQGVGV